jgi:hypothetical protein
MKTSRIVYFGIRSLWIYQEGGWSWKRGWLKGETGRIAMLYMIDNEMESRVSRTFWPMKIPWLAVDRKGSTNFHCPNSSWT